MDTTGLLARFAVETTFEGLPDSTVHAAKRSLVDSVGVMVAGSRHRAVETLISVMPTGGRHRLVARTDTMGIIDATTLNGVMAHVLDFDDTILPTRCHISAPMVSALLAASEEEAPSGRDVLAAFVVGFELVTRTADSVYDGNTGWHGTGVMGPLGVAAAVGRLFGLDVDGTVQALAIAANSAAGLRASFGSMTKSLNLGKAGGNGMLSALLARRGFTGGVGILDEDSRFLRLFSDSPDTSILVNQLSERWAVERNGFKPHPCGFVAHAAIDAALEVRRIGGVPPEEVRDVRLIVPPETMRLTANRHPKTGLEAKFSVFHAVAAAYADGYVSPETFTDAAAVDPRYTSLAARIVTEVDRALAQDQAHISIVSSDGREVDATIEHALGTESNPMSDDQLTEKFQRLVEPVLPHTSSQILDVLWSFDDRDMSDLLPLLEPRE
ncbi:MAG TPA: MmgE/PrpD family protein [Acidimicrobiia bacterium]|nr:MmgE/PrpD family protein [Acidimicrobiia bacterium]